MASNRLDGLVPELREKAGRVIEQCAARGVELLITCTYRSPEEQAILYRKTRTKETIEEKLLRYRERGFGFLADILEAVGSQRGHLGQHITQAGPGESRHNYGLAFDAYPTVYGKPLWNPHVAGYEWDIYGEVLAGEGLTWGGRWITSPEFPHAQLGNRGNPLHVLPPNRVKDLLSEPPGNLRGT